MSVARVREMGDLTFSETTPGAIGPAASAEVLGTPAPSLLQRALALPGEVAGAAVSDVEGFLQNPAASVLPSTGKIALVVGAGVLAVGIVGIAWWALMNKVSARTREDRDAVLRVVSAAK